MVLLTVTAGELELMVREFRKFAIDGVLISFEDFTSVMTAIGLDKLPHPRLFEVFDVDANGEVCQTLEIHMTRTLLIRRLPFESFAD